MEYHSNEQFVNALG